MLSPSLHASFAAVAQPFQVFRLDPHKLERSPRNAIDNSPANGAERINVDNGSPLCIIAYSLAPLFWPSPYIVSLWRDVCEAGGGAHRPIGKQLPFTVLNILFLDIVLRGLFYG